MSTSGDEEIVSDELAKALPNAPSGLVFPPAMDFAADAADLKPGPVGPARYENRGKLRQLTPQVPNYLPYRFGGLPLNVPGSATISVRIQIDRPSILLVYDWVPGSLESPLGKIIFAPASSTSPDFSAVVSGSERAWEVGEGKIAFLPTPGDWFVAAITEDGAVANAVSAYVLIDATNPAVADRYCRQFSNRPDSFDAGIGGSGPNGNILIAAATPQLILQDDSFIRTAISVQVVAAGSVRINFGVSAACVSGGGAGWLLSNGQLPFIITREMLLESDMWAYSGGGTTIALATFGQSNWQDI